MKLRVRVVVILLVLTAVCVWLLLPNNKAERAAERVRQRLRQEGFKTDLSEFDLSVPPRLSANNELLMLAGDASRSRNVLTFLRLDLMRPIGSNSAMVSWNHENSESLSMQNYNHRWQDLRDAVAEHRDLLDQACRAVIEAPFRFKTEIASDGEPTPDAARVRLLGSAIAARTILALHEQNHLDTWTNLLALTRLITAWQTEPMALSHAIRFRWVATAHRVIWEALQANDWTEAELAVLQHEWETPNFFDGLSETAALARAGTIAYCSFARLQPPPPGPTLREFASEFINSPNRALSGATSGWRNARYRNVESYEDETAWLLYFRDCELDYRKAIAANSWFEMRDFPSATSYRPAQSSNSLPYNIGMNRSGPGGGWVSGWVDRQGQTLSAQAAQAEATRRLISTAIAVKRFYLSNHRYPDSLAKLVPDFLKAAPVDFMDGKTLRYHRADDDRFILYSVGLDGIDHHGLLLAERSNSAGGPPYGWPQGPDLVWPLPASPGEVRDYAQAIENGRVFASRPQIMTSEGRPFRRYTIDPSAVRTNGFGIRIAH